MSRFPRSSLQSLTLCALFAALMCMLSPIAIPIGPIPLSLGLLGVLLTAATLPPIQSVSATAVFLALGVCGLPVFSAGTAGVTVLFSPLGGYLWSYLLIAPIVSLIASRSPRNARFPIPTFLASLLSLPICYLCGTVQYIFLTHTPVLTALPLTTLPFLPLDLLKASLATLLSARLKKLLKHTDR